MPYIEKDKRLNLVEGNITPGTAGDLNFVITKKILEYMSLVGKTYANYNTVIGVLECVKLEFYRRAVELYENEKISQNGDVY